MLFCRSLEGSSISYAFEVKPVNVVIRRNNLNPCNKKFTPESGLTGLLSGHSLPDLSNNISLSCNYTFDASKMQQGRVKLKIFTSLRAAKECSDCKQEPLFAEVKLGLGERLCFCKVNLFTIGFLLFYGDEFNLYRLYRIALL